jgi:hypothetical protein
MLLKVRGGIAVICVLTVRIYGLRRKSMLLHEPQWNCAFAPFVASAVPSEDRTYHTIQQYLLCVTETLAGDVSYDPKRTFQEV